MPSNTTPSTREGGVAPPSNERPFQLLVRGPQRTHTIDHMHPDDLTIRLQALIEIKVSIPPHASWLTSGGKRLDPCRPLARYGLRAGSTVHLAVRGVGGGCSGSKSEGAGGVARSIGGGLPRPQEQQGEPIQQKRSDRYTAPASIWEALATGHVKLVKATYLITLADEGGTLCRRQELPESAFISVEELIALFGDGNDDGVLPIISISFCWDTAAHPDPSGKQLAKVAATLKGEMPKYKEPSDSFHGFTEMGVFWDWASLSQKDPKLWTPACKKEVDDLILPAEKEEKERYEASRTAEEVEGFKYALHETMDLWYAHQGTTVYMLTTLPEGSTRTVGYEDSGWTTYERRSAEQIKKVYLYEAKWKLVLDLGEGADAEKSRNWPLDPDGFDALIETKTFTNGADKDAVKELYRKMSVDQLGGIEMLDFTGIATPTIKDMGQLGRCLNLCKALKKCDLNGVGLTDETCEALLSTLTNEAHVEELILADNSLAVEAARSVAAYVRVSGSLTKLDVSYNSLGEEGEEALQKVVKGRDGFSLET